jgi:hypothetical protein
MIVPWNPFALGYPLILDGRFQNHPLRQLINVTTL